MIHITGNAKSQITNVDEKLIQPNAIDLRIKVLFKHQAGNVVLCGDNKVHRPTTKMLPEDGMYHLEAGTYDVLFDHDVVIAEGEAGFLIQRSTLNRNGITVTSGLYDSGYDNAVGGCLHIPQGVTLSLGENERIAQLLMFEAETVTMYDGIYNKKEI